MAWPSRRPEVHQQHAVRRAGQGQGRASPRPSSGGRGDGVDVLHEAVEDHQHATARGPDFRPPQVRYLAGRRLRGVRAAPRVSASTSSAPSGTWTLARCSARRSSTPTTSLVTPCAADRRRSRSGTDSTPLTAETSMRTRSTSRIVVALVALAAGVLAPPRPEASPRTDARDGRRQRLVVQADQGPPVTGGDRARHLRGQQEPARPALLADARRRLLRLRARLRQPGHRADRATRRGQLRTFVDRVLAATGPRRSPWSATRRAG